MEVLVEMVTSTMDREVVGSSPTERKLVAQLARALKISFSHVAFHIGAIAQLARAFASQAKDLGSMPCGSTNGYA